MIVPGEKATLERELVAEVRKLQAELRQAREVLSEEGARTSCVYL